MTGARGARRTRTTLLFVATAATAAAAWSTAAFAQLVSPASATDVAPVTVTGKKAPAARWQPGPNPIPIEFGAYTEWCWQIANDPMLADTPSGPAVFLPTRYARNPDYNAPPLTPPGSPFPAVLSMNDYIRGKPGDPNRNLSIRGKLRECLGITQGAPSMAAQMSVMASRVSGQVRGDSAGGQIPMGIFRADGFGFSHNGRAEIRGRSKALPLGFALFDHGRYAEALTQFKAAERRGTGGGEARLMIGKIYLYGLREKSDPVEGVKWLKGLVNLSFDRTTQTPAFDPWEPDKTTPNGEAALILADVYGRGHGPIAKDPALARRYLEAAYNVGHIAAATALGDIYYNGVDVAPDRAKAFDWYVKAARFGHAPAAVAVARMYEAGEVDGAADRKTILGWYAQAAKVEHPQALQALAAAYDQGDGVPANPQRALALYKLAATQGDPAAQTAIGTYFYTGESELPKDPALARKWFELAAAAGDADGMFNLAAMQAKGEGGPADRVQAWGWLKIAEKLGHANAGAAARALEERFTPEDRVGVAELKRAG